jgi:lysophospholipase L1-like esterase
MPNLVCFGDTITARTEGHLEPLLTLKLKSKLPDWEIINTGVPGNNTFDAVQRIDRDVLTHNFDLVTVLFGANDAAFHKVVELKDYQSNLMEIVRKITPLKTILISPAAVDEDLQHARTNAVLKNYSEVVQDVSIKTGCHFIDLYSRMITTPNYQEMLKGEKKDGLHFGELGYDFLSDNIVMKMKLLGW